MQLDMRRGYTISKDNKRHYLTVPKVGEEDFANYTCQASNSLGKSRGLIQLRGIFIVRLTQLQHLLMTRQPCPSSVQQQGGVHQQGLLQGVLVHH